MNIDSEDVILLIDFFNKNKDKESIIIDIDESVYESERKCYVDVYRKMNDELDRVDFLPVRMPADVIIEIGEKLGCEVSGVYL